MLCRGTPVSLTIIGGVGAARPGPLAGGFGAGLLGTNPVSFGTKGPVDIMGVERGTGGGDRGFSKLVSVGGNRGLAGGLIIGLIAAA